ncbi:MAG TPA: DUF6531 domain-containing protein [Actinospica sp.]|nr:DUF6531 domain-containing protein [Actinospica sp.]
MPGKGFMVQTAENAAKDLSEACDSSAQTISKNMITKVADTEEGNLGRTLEGETKVKKSFADILKAKSGEAEKGPTGAKPPAGGAAPKGGGPSTSGGSVQDDFKGGGKGGQAEDGNGKSTTGGTDPIDVVSGQLLSGRIDVGLPGVLPLVLRRAYASGYEHGRLLGPGWSSTLDQRLVVDDEGVHYLGEDGEALSYPVPAAGQQVLPSGGARWPLTWDRALDAISLLDRESGLTRHFAAPPSDAEPDAHGRQVRHLTRITDRNGNWINISRDSDGVPTLVDHCGGYRIGIDSSYRAGGFRIEGLRLIDAAHPEGAPLVRYGYDPHGRLVEITDSTDVALVYEYDDADRITAWIDRAGYRYEYVYDDAGRVVRAAGEDGTMTSELAYDPDNRVTRVTDSLGTTEYHYDQYQRVCKTVDPLGAITLTESDRYGRVLSTTDALGHVTRFSLDEHGQPVLIERPDGTSVAIEYDELSNPTSVTGPDGSVDRYTYDAQGNTTSATDPAGATTVYEYDDRGGLIRVTDALGATTSAELDRAGLLKSVSDRAGSVWTFARDEAGRVVSVSDPRGAVATTAYDGEGRPVSRTHPDGTSESWAYDVNGDLAAHTDRGGNTTAYEYGPFHALRRRTEPDGVVYRFTHDADLRLTSVTNPQGLTWDYSFDAAGNLVGESDFNGRALTYRYDAAGRLVSRTNGAGEELEFRRDALGRVVEQRDGEAVTVFEYEADGLLRRVADSASSVEFARDAARRVIAETVDGRTLSRAYDAVGRQIGRTTPGGRASSWTYDADGRTQRLLAGERQISFGYDEAGNETYRWIGDSLALTSEWDAESRLTSRSVLGVTGPEHARTSAVLHQRSWAYEAAGLPASVTDTAEGTRRLTHDAQGRITAVTAEGWSERYGYDAAGNLTRAEDSRAAQEGTEARELTGTLLRRAGRTSYTYDGQGRLVKAVRRTISGTEKVWTYAYDAQDRLIEAVNPAGEQWRYAYDPLGRRIAKRRLGAEGETVEEIRFTWDGSVLAEQEHVLAGNDLVTATAWDYEPGTWTPLAQDRRSYYARAPQELIDQRFHAIVTDLVGTPTELVTAEGEVAWRRRTDLWGRSVPDGDAALCPIGFPGQYHDPETGLAYNNKRYYDPETGRYTTPDPLGLDPAPNHHAYVHNPLVAADPLGLEPEGGYTDLYHGTDKAGAAAIRRNGVDPSFGPRPMDFGNGFYTTRNFNQAKKWADRKPGGGVVLHFRVPNSELSKLDTKTFSGDSQELRDFVTRFRNDRSGRKTPTQDVVEGPMLMNPQDFRRGAAPTWRGNQVVFFHGTGPLLDSSLQP